MPLRPEKNWHVQQGDLQAAVWWKGRGLQGKREEAQRFRARLGFWPVSEREKQQGERKHA